MRFLILSFVPLLAGCGALRYDHEPVKVAGSVWVATPRIVSTHQELNRISACNAIRAAAIEALRKDGFEIAADEASADLVLEAEIQDLWLGAEAVRLLAWRAERMDIDEPWHKTKITIRPRGAEANATSRSDHVDAGGYTKVDAEWVRTRALAGAIAGLYLRTANDFRK